MDMWVAYLPSSVTTISGNLVQYFFIFKKKSSSYIILVIHDIEAHKMLHHATYVCKYVLVIIINNMYNLYVHINIIKIIIARKASLLLIQMEPAVYMYKRMYVFMYVYMYVCIYPVCVRIRQPALRANVAS